MQIVDMVAMLYSRVAAANAMRVIMMFVMGKITVAHSYFLLISKMFAGVIDRVINQREHVVVGNRIDGILPVFAPLHEACS